MTSGHDQPAHSADISSPHPGPDQARGRRVAALLAAAVPLAAAALATAPAGTAFAAAPPAAMHASAMLSGSDCLAAFGGHQAPKLPECLND